MTFKKDRQFYRFSAYGFLKNLRFFEPFMVLYFRENGFSFLQIGLLFSIRETATLLLEVPTGFVADIRGRKTSMLFSMASYLVSFLVFFHSASFAVSAAAMLLYASGEAFRTGTHKAMILEYLKVTGQGEWKADYYGATRSASMLGSALNAVLAAILVFYSGSYRYVFLAALFPYILNMLNLASYPSFLNWAGLREGKKRPSMRESLSHTLAMLKDSRARRGIMNSAAFDAVFKVEKEYLQPVIKAAALGLPLLMALQEERRVAVVVGLVFSVLYLLASASSRFAGRVGRRLGGVVPAMNRTWIAASLILVAAGVFHRLDAYFVTILAYVVLYMLQNLRRPLCVSYISGSVNDRVMSVGLSLESLVKTLFMAVLAPLCGLAADRVGIGLMMTASGVLMIMVYGVLKMQREQTED